MALSVEQIMEALATIIADATVSDESGEPELDEEELERYEALEVELQTAQNHAGVLLRHAAYTTAVPPSGIHVAGTDEDEGDEVLNRAFEHYLRTGKENDDMVELRAQGEMAGTEGGFTTPDSFRKKLVDTLLAFGGVGAEAEQLNTANGNPMPWPTLDDTANTGAIVAEAGTFSGGADLVFGSATLGAYKYMAGGAGALPLRVSVELLQDSAFDVAALVASKLGIRIARIQATHLVTGTGVEEPQGLTDGLTGIEIAADTAGVVYDDLVTFIHSVDPAYRDNARWGFNDTTLETLEKLKDAAGDPIWRGHGATMVTGAQGDAGKVGQTGTLLGYPYFVDQAFPDITVANNTINWGVFGNIKQGMVVRRIKDVTLIVNPWTRAANGQVEYTAWARMDAVQQDTNAYVALTGEQ